MWFKAIFNAQSIYREVYGTIYNFLLYPRIVWQNLDLVGFFKLKWSKKCVDTVLYESCVAYLYGTCHMHIHVLHTCTCVAYVYTRVSLIFQHVNFLMHRIFFLSFYKILTHLILTHLEYYNPWRLASEHVHISYTSKAAHWRCTVTLLWV